MTKVCVHCWREYEADSIANRYCSLECLCLYNAERARERRLAGIRLPYKED